MVESQLVRRHIRDPRVLDAMQRIPRHFFVPEREAQRAYNDCPVPIGVGQTISQPYMVALMTQLLDIRPEDRILEIGTGSGYQTAILALLASDVMTIERHEELAIDARARLDELGYDNVQFMVGDGTLGYPDAGPYDGIIVTAGSPDVPKTLQTQLAEGGRLLCPIGSREEQRLVLCTREGDTLKQRDSVPCVFVPLIGEEGW